MPVGLPIIFTVRTRNQGGSFPDDEASVLRLMGVGRSAGCEVLDMECCWSESFRSSVLSSRRSERLIASYHAVQAPTPVTQLPSLFAKCFGEGDVDVVKVVTRAYSPTDGPAVVAAGHAAALPVPFIALCTTPLGAVSRVLNQSWTPVTHPALPAAAAPGQLSSAEIQQARVLVGMAPRRQFWLFGKPISASPSPVMHNAGFRLAGVGGEFEYGLCETDEVEGGVVGGVGEVIRRPGFGGASVTIPLKVDVIPLMDRLSDAAREIGAVNTIVPVTEAGADAPTFFGDNTDWIGILAPVQARLAQLGRRASPEDPITALVLGAGGTARAAAYAMTRLGATLLLHNRTRSKAQALAEQFNGSVLPDLTPESVARVDVVVCTLPPAAGFTLPPHLLPTATASATGTGSGSGSGSRLQLPVVMDVVYIPAVTPLLRQAKTAGCACIPGSEMLWRQGEAAFRLWTGRAPAGLGGVMEAAVMEKVLAASSGSS